MSRSAHRIVIAAGGTAGHVVPALAVAEALRADGVEVAFIGGARAEAELVPAAGFALCTIRVEGLNRSNPVRALRALVLALVAMWRSRRILSALRPDAVMGGGGYVSAPVVAAALTLRVPVVLTEADSAIGLSNRLLAPLARRVCLSFPPAGHSDGPQHNGDDPRRAGRAQRRASRRRSPRYRVTGRPVHGPPGDRAQARRRFDLGAQETCVVVFGGSQGARSINRAAIDAFAGASFAVLHICGARDYPELSRRPLRGGYQLFAQLALADFYDALAASDLAVARAGGSIFELAANGLPAILIPYPHAAADHQSANAAWMVRAGAAVAIADRELTAARLGHEVASLLADRSRLRAMAAASRRLARPGAAAEVAHALLEVAGG